MAGVVVHEYPVDQILTLDAFGIAHSLTIDVTEARDGQWSAKINAYTPARYDSAAGRNVPRALIATAKVKSQAAAQTELATQLTSLNTIELADGTKVDISLIRVTAT